MPRDRKPKILIFDQAGNGSGNRRVIISRAELRELIAGTASDRVKAELLQFLDSLRPEIENGD